jgi:hypothetical protein
MGGKKARGSIRAFQEDTLFGGCGLLPNVKQYSQSALAVPIASCLGSRCLVLSSQRLESSLNGPRW